MNNYPRYFENSPRFMNYKNGSDLFLGYLMSISTYDPKAKNIYLYQDNFYSCLSQFQSILHSKSAATISNQLRYWRDRSDGLVEVGPVTTTRGKAKPSIIITPKTEKGTSWTKIANNIVFFLAHSEIPNILRIYVHLVCQYNIRYSSNYVFTKKEIMEAIGYSGKASSKVKTETQKALTFLQKSNLVKFHHETRMINNHVFRCHVLDFVEMDTLPRQFIYEEESIEEYQKKIKEIMNSQEDPEEPKTAEPESPRQEIENLQVCPATNLQLQKSCLEEKNFFYNINNWEDQDFLEKLNIRRITYSSLNGEQKAWIVPDKVWNYIKEDILKKLET